MSVWKRIGNLFAKPAPPMTEKSMLALAPGDICEVSLVSYEVTGRVGNRGRNAVVLTLQDGSRISYLLVEERETLQYQWYQPIDGRLDDPTEVPSQMELDGTEYFLDEEYGVTCPWLAKRRFCKAESSTCGNTSPTTASCCVSSGKMDGLCCTKASR